MVVADGRGTPGRGSAWERAVCRDLAGPVLDDQVEALHGAPTSTPSSTWRGSRSAAGRSAGTWRRWPSCAAPTCSTRRWPARRSPTGGSTTRTTPSATSATPTRDPEPYDRTILLRDADQPRRPLLLIHGLADDNVVSAHTLQLSSALLAAGRPHQVLPLSGVTHMTPQEVVAENLLLLQLAFLRQALHLDT